MRSEEPTKPSPPAEKALLKILCHEPNPNSTNASTPGSGLTVRKGVNCLYHHPRERSNADVMTPARQVPHVSPMFAVDAVTPARSLLLGRAFANQKRRGHPVHMISDVRD